MPKHFAQGVERFNSQEKKRVEGVNSKNAAVFFDRDGVINCDIGYLSRPEDFVWVEGAKDALRLVNTAGILAVVVTNQSGVARGYYGEAEVDTLHQWISDELEREGIHIDAYYSCPYHEEAIVSRYRVDNHPDRKPNPGMILTAMRDWNIDPGCSFIVGDKLTDIEAGHRAGIRGVLYQGGNLAEVIAPFLP